ncbi:MAG: preprotein translocase subunit SecE [Desulfuromusa sp.]|nr:preprotein translocase subunit SecE [Desulfuromusa sp.]
MFGNLNEFFTNVKAELKKVTWPTRKDTYASTMVVIMLVIISAIFLGGVDVILSRLIRLILG